MEHMKDFHSIKVDPHQKGFGNLPDGCQQLLKACQVAERDYMMRERSPAFRHLVKFSDPQSRPYF